MRAEQEGAIHVLAPRGRVQAALVVAPDPEGSMGFPVTKAELYRGRRSARSRAWFQARIPASENLELMLDAALTDLLPDLEAAGLRVELEVSVGATRTAHRRSRGDPTFAERGIDCKPLETAAEADAAFEILRAELRGNPAYAWLAVRPEYLELRNQQLRDSAGDPGAQSLLLLEAGRVQGLASATTKLEDPVWGTSARTEIFLAQALRGRGLTRAVYRELHCELQEARVRVLVGGSSHPAMLHLYQAWGRRAFSYLLRRAGPSGAPEASAAIRWNR